MTKSIFTNRYSKLREILIKVRKPRFLNEIYPCSWVCRRRISENADWRRE